MENLFNYIGDNILVIPFITGIVFLITSIITLLFPPKNINFFYGYRTKNSMKTQERWDFAQRYSSNKMFWSGLILIVFSFSNLIFGLDIKFQLIISALVIVLPCVYLFYSTEKALKNNFTNE